VKKHFDFLKNALEPTIEDDPATPVVRKFRLFFYPLIFVGIFLAIFSFQVLLSGDGLGETLSNGAKKFSFLNILGLSSERDLSGQADDRINILLTGMGGLGHQGPFLTDTIILASIRPSDGKVALLSIPRDLSVSIPGYGWRKINNVNHYGELNNPGNGADETKKFMEDLLDTNIDYYVRVDFSGFEKLIDELGGIDVYVDNAFTDTEFPDDNYGYQTISFPQGWQKMNGTTALNYARSRHGNNGEGSDFARSQRQQKVIKAIKDKVLSVNTLINPLKLNSLFEAYQTNVSTNIKLSEIPAFAKLAKKIDDEKLHTMILDNSPDGLLYSTMVNGAYLLVPKDESFYEIQQVVAHIFDDQKSLERDERPTVEIRNGTPINGLAYDTSVALTKKGFDVIKIGNALEKTYEKTVIYDLSRGQKPRSLERLVKELNANVSTAIPSWFEVSSTTDDSGTVLSASSGADFLVVTGAPTP